MSRGSGPGQWHGCTNEVAYLLTAENNHRPLLLRLRDVHPPVIHSRNPFARPHPARVASICTPLNLSTPRSSMDTGAETVGSWGPGGTRNIRTSPSSRHALRWSAKV